MTAEDITITYSHSLMLRYVPILLLLLTIPTRANLGETMSQTIKRYGKPVGLSESNDKTPFDTLVFAAGPYNLVLFFTKDSKEVGARVSKIDKSAFTDAEMKTIMDADSLATDAWTSVPSDDPTELQWSRGDKAKVLYDKARHMLIFTSDEMKKIMDGK